MSVVNNFLESEHSAVTRFGADVDTPSRHAATTIHSGGVISPDLDSVRNDWSGFRSEGTVIMGGFHRLHEPIGLELPDASGVGRALVVGERVGRFTVTSFVHTDNRREPRTGAINRVSFVTKQRDSIGEELAQGMIRALQREDTYDELRDLLGEEFVPSNLRLAAVALYDEGAYKIRRQFD